ncbi:MAG: hypothetical protein ACTSPY_11705 [Candidatus Helarchaeota archaeon]
MKKELKLLNRELITGLNYQLEPREIPIFIPDEKIFQYPEKVMILGNDELLHTTIDYIFNILIKNEEFKGRIVYVVMEGENNVDNYNIQDCLYTLCLRGISGEKVEEKYDLIFSISQILKDSEWDKVVENFIRPEIEILVCYYSGVNKLLDKNDSIKKKPPNSFIGRLLALIYERYRRFKSKDNKLILLSLNPRFKGDKTLRDLILDVGKQWNLGEKFLSWVRLRIKFLDSMIDKFDIGGIDDEEKNRIFEKLNYKDNLLKVTENYYKWIINVDENKVDFPIPTSKINVEFTSKLDIIHTLNTWFNAVLVAFIPLAFLSGYNKTNEALIDVIIRDFFERFLFDTIRRFVDLSKEEIEEWEKITINRLKNPFNNKTLLDTSKNLIQKFRTDFLYKMIDIYEREKEIPDYIFFILATFLRFYNVIEEEEGKFFGIRNLTQLEADELIHESDENLDAENVDEEKISEYENNGIYEVIDDLEILKEFASTWKNVKIDDPKSIKIFLGYILTQKHIWGMDLTLWPNLMERTGYYLQRLLQEDIGKITSELILGIEN